MGSPREAGTRFSRNSERKVGAKARSSEPRPPGSSDESRTPDIGPRSAAPEVFEKISAPGARASRRAEPLHWLLTTTSGLHHWHLPAGECAPEPLDHPSSSFFQGPLEGGAENLTVPVSTVHGDVQARPVKPVRLGADPAANPY